MIYYETGSANTDLSAEDLKEGMFAALEKMGRRQKVLAIFQVHLDLLDSYCKTYAGHKEYNCLRPAIICWQEYVDLMPHAGFAPERTDLANRRPELEVRFASPA